MTVYGLMLMMALQTTRPYSGMNCCQPLFLRKIRSPYTYYKAIK